MTRALTDSLHLYRRLLGAQLCSQMQYRTAFVFDVISTMLFTITEFGALALTFQRFPSIGGWNVLEVMFLYGLVEFSFGLMDMIFAGFDPPRFAEHIRKGTLDQFLLRPSSLYVQIFGSDFTLRRIGRLLLSAGIFAYAVIHLEVHWTLEKIVYLPFVILGMVLFFGGLFIVGATITFWTIESTEAMNILTYGGSSLIQYPMNIYNEWLRQFFTFVVPALFLNYQPALWFLGKPDPFHLPEFTHFLSPIAGGSVFIVSLVFWNFGLQRYQGTGN
jgi:ABC-2 type transport system permease protein